MVADELGEGTGRAAGQVQHRGTDQVLPAGPDAALHGGEGVGELARYAGGPVGARQLIGPDVQHPDRVAGVSGDDRRRLPVAQRLRPGEEVVAQAAGIGIGAGQQGSGRRRDVPRVDPAQSAVTCGGADLAVPPDSLAERVGAKEVLHEPGRAQHDPARPFPHPGGQFQRAGSVRRHDGGAEQHHAAHAEAVRLGQERTDLRHRIHDVHRGHEEDSVHPPQRGRVGGRVVPVEPDRVGITGRGVTAGHPDPHPGASQQVHQRAPGLPRAAGHQYAAHRAAFGRSESSSSGSVPAAAAAASGFQ